MDAAEEKSFPPETTPFWAIIRTVIPPRPRVRNNDHALVALRVALIYFLFASHFEVKPSVLNSPLSFPSFKVPVISIDSCFLNSRIKLNLPSTHLPSLTFPSPVTQD